MRKINNFMLFILIVLNTSLFLVMPFLALDIQSSKNPIIKIIKMAFLLLSIVSFIFGCGLSFSILLFFVQITLEFLITISKNKP